MSADEHREWLKLGETQLGHGHFRRALGSFRRSQQTDQRGENSFQLHNAVSAITMVLLQQHRFFLHVHDESKLFARRAPASVDLEAVARTAEALKGELKSSVHGALDAMAACARAGALLPDYADQSPAAELEAHGGAAAMEFVEQWFDAEKWLYEDLLNREEPVISAS